MNTARPASISLVTSRHSQIHKHHQLASEASDAGLRLLTSLDSTVSEMASVQSTAGESLRLISKQHSFMLQRNRNVHTQFQQYGVLHMMQFPLKFPLLPVRFPAWRRWHKQSFSSSPVWWELAQQQHSPCQSCVERTQTEWEEPPD